MGYAPEIYTIVWDHEIADFDDDQLYYTLIFLDQQKRVGFILALYNLYMCGLEYKHALSVSENSMSSWCTFVMYVYMCKPCLNTCNKHSLLSLSLTHSLTHTHTHTHTHTCID